MGSFSSRQNVVSTNVVPKPLDVLPATESWSTLDAFQATVKKNEHHELINRSKTQKSLLRKNSFFKDNFKRRTKTLTTIPANLPSSSEQQSKFSKKRVTIRAKTQFNVTPSSCSSDESDSIHPLPHLESQYSQSRLNERRPTHFYAVRQAMVNRLTIQKLESLISEDHLPSSTDLNETNLVNKSVAIPHSTEEVEENDVICKPDSTEHSTTTSQSLKKSIKDTQEKIASKPSVSTFKVNPVPHTTFAPQSQLSEHELECRSTITKITALCSEESDRKEIEEVLLRWKNSGQLASIETHALTVSQSQTTTISELADSLTNNNVDYIKAIEGSIVHVQVAKAYCIYVWIANNIVYDAEHWKKFISGDHNILKCSTEAEEVLTTRVTVCTGYANLFKALSCMCGLEVKVIGGHAKLWKSLSEEKPDADSPFKPSRQNAHTWNSIVFGCKPYLLDCTFASGYVTSAMNFCKSFNRHYFAVPPQQFILTHWPSNDSWQLLSKPLILEKFQPLIPVPSSTIGLGIEPETWSEVVEVLDDPVACIRMKCKDNLAILATLVATNVCTAHEISTSSNQELTFIIREENSISIRASPPHKGQFILNIYACESVEDISNPNHRLILSYLIHNKREIVNQVGYPIVDHATSSNFSFKLIHWNAPRRDCCCENLGKTDAIFRAKPNLQFYHCIMPGKTADGVTPSPAQANDFHHFNTVVAQNQVGDPSLFMLRAIFPKQGWWSLYLYAKKSEIDTDFESEQNNTYALILVYNVYVQIGIPEHSYPNILSPYINMLLPDSVSACGDEIFPFYFHSSRKFDFHSYLTYGQQTGESVDGYTTVEIVSGSNQCKLNVIFPKPGKWYVHVFGKDIANPEQMSYSGLFVLQIKVDASLKNTMFPKVNRVLSDTLNVKYLNSGSVTFKDDGSPFNFKVVVPKKSIDFIHSIKPHVTDTTNFNDEGLLQHCTSLSFEKYAEDSNHPNFMVCSLNAVFPLAGMWTVQLCAGSIGSNSYECLIEVKLPVSNPTPNLCYIKVHPSFYHLEVSIQEKFLLYNPTTDKSEIEIPFKAPKEVQFVWNMEYVKSGEKFFHQAIIHQLENFKPDFDDIQEQDCLLHVIFPKPGDWIFHLYGKTNSNELHKEKHNYQSIMEININASSFNNEFGFPHTFDPFRNVFGMKLDKEKLPLVSKVSCLPSTVSIPFYSPANVKLWYDIEVNNNSIVQPSAQLNCVSEKLHMHELTIEVNKMGKWTVILYAQLTDSLKKNWTAVLKHTVSSV